MDYQKYIKLNCPLRPIISAVGTYNYKLAKWLVEILSPLLDNNKYILKDTFDFVNKVSKLNTIIDKSMLSFDVESLFTNMLTLETIDIILKRIYSNETEHFHDLNKDEFEKVINRVHTRVSLSI